RDRIRCRRELGIPTDAMLIGTAGGLHRDKGVAVLYEAWKLLKPENPALRLVLAGPFDPSFPPPSDDRVHYLGALPHARVAELFSALDVGVMCILDTSFGRYCFPQKAYEMLACGLAVVASDVGAMHALFNGYPDCLFRSEDAEELAAKIRNQL